jgi:hypothetical protein
MDENKEPTPEVPVKEDRLEEFLKWRTLNPDQPLFLPAGSVRAVIAVGLLIFCGVLVTQGIAIPEWFSSITSMSVAFYFGGRATKP